jgi:pilus assembly protein CpaF
MHEIFSFEKKGIGPDGRVMGTFQPSRIRPKFLEQLRIAGVMLPSSMFENVQEVN